MKRIVKILIFYSLCVCIFYKSWSILLYKVTIANNVDSQNYMNGAYEPNPNKFLIYTCVKGCGIGVKSCVNASKCGGLGDRLKGITTSFLWAILTNRTFLINSKSPCSIEKSLDSNDIKWYKNLKETIEKVNNGRLSSARFELYHGGSHFKQINPNLDARQNWQLYNLLDYEKDTDVIIVSSDFIASKIMLDTKRFGQRLQQLGFSNGKFDEASIFRLIYRMLFKLQPHLQYEFDMFMSKVKRTPNTKLICAQIRTGGNGKYFNDKPRVNLKNTHLIWKFIREKFTNLIDDYKIYVTSDRDEVIDEAKKQFGSDTVMVTNGITTHLDLDIHQNNTAECNKRYDKTYLDFHLLQTCDMGVVSISGYSKLGIYNMNKSTENIYVFHYSYEKNKAIFQNFNSANFGPF